MQIDLLFDRQDGAITLCDMKYGEKPFVIEKAHAKRLVQSTDAFAKHFKTTKQIFFAFITTAGVKASAWAEELVDKEVKLKDLFC